MPRSRDYDGAVAGLGPWLDGLGAGGVLVDDGPDHVRLELGPERNVRLEVRLAAASSCAMDES